MDASVQRILAAVVLVAFVSGCASYRPASLSLDEAADAGATVHDEVEAGQKVRLTLVSGEVIEGEVASVTEDGLTVGRSGNYGYTERTVAANEIALLEIQSWSSGSKIAVYTAAGVFVVGALAVGLFVDGMADGLGGSK
jgi:hypothetical protein